MGNNLESSSPKIINKNLLSKSKQGFNNITTDDVCSDWEDYPQKVIG